MPSLSPRVPRPGAAPLSAAQPSAELSAPSDDTEEKDLEASEPRAAEAEKVEDLSDVEAPHPEVETAAEVEPVQVVAAVARPTRLPVLPASSPVTGPVSSGQPPAPAKAVPPE